ncbi:MAG: 50S ribosomal protein L10 [Candidatus Atelocyanobacterium thalassa]
MGRTKENKAMVISNLKELLDGTELSFVIDYQGLSVAEITDLRDRLRPSGAICKVTKNTFMEKAVIDSDKWKPITSFLNGSSAFILVKEDLGGAIRAYQAFKKETKKTAFRGGVMEGKTLNEEQVKAIADLPSKEELMGQTAGLINSVTAKLAIGINEMPTSLGRGINEIPNSLGRVLAAVAAKKES